jgi:hypothetical protein
MTSTFLRCRRHDDPYHRTDGRLPVCLRIEKVAAAAAAGDVVVACSALRRSDRQRLLGGMPHRLRRARRLPLLNSTAE